MVEMRVHRIGMDQQGQALVVLIDGSEERLLPILIGHFEAYAIAMEVHGEKFKRPLTHDLFINTLEALGHRIERVEITKLERGTFYALLHVSAGAGKIAVDGRPSDAIALALRASAPIYIAEDVLEQAQVLVSDTGEGDDTEKFRELIEKVGLGEEPDLADSDESASE
jgi:bifunctional DNase/RNase